MSLVLFGGFTVNAADADGFVPLFPGDGPPQGWVVRAWDDVSKPAKEPPVWKVEQGVLQAGGPRGSWLMSERQYADFTLEYEFKLGPTGNSGCALRSPMRGDPAFDGMELQMADFRYNTKAKPSELTGGLYRAVAPTKQVYRPTEWNKVQITLQGSHLKVVLNGETIQDINLDEQTQEVKRHDGTVAPPIKARPRRGHIGFQELSRGDERAQIRGARIKVLAGLTEEAAATMLPVWQPHEMAFTAASDHPWWEFPVRAEFKREGGGGILTVEGYWDGGRRWVVRTALPRPGVWLWRIESADGGLRGHSGRIEVVAPQTDQVQGNPNLRGQVRIASSGRHFEYADGTPFFLLADTLWAGNTARCGLGTDGAGPFTEFLADRKAKGFTAVLMQLIHGYGDYPDGQAHRNEGGYAFTERDPARLNSDYFEHLDRRMRALWERGFVAATPTMWWGKTKKGFFTPEDARRLSAYCTVRYGAFNALWCVSGEYQYVFKDCGWTSADLSALGLEVQRHNPWRRPLSIHPSGQITWKPPHNVQSSRPFHGEPWLDHHWLQTGQSLDRLCNIVTRLADDRALQPALPVFCSEAFYEVVTDPDSAFHARWQVWTAFLNGAAGYGYGVQGLWQFLDRSDPQGETGKLSDSRPVPWREAMRLPGSAQVGHARTLLTSLPWWKLEPRRDALRVDGKPNPLPTQTDLTPPQAATVGGKTWVIYLPRGNANREIQISGSLTPDSRGRWFDPRTGAFVGEASSITSGLVPSRPKLADEDWVLLVE